MNERFPIIFIHRGYSEYMEFSLRQATVAAPGQRVILLGNEHDLQIPGVEFHSIDDYVTDDLITFRDHYIHMSFWTEKFELFCFERWFLLAEFMRRNNLTQALALDTDIMAYSGAVDHFEAISGQVKCGLAEQLRMVAAGQINSISGHSSYWTLKGITDFEEFLVKLYVEPRLLERLKTKWDGYSKTHIYGGVTDMDGLALYKEYCLKDSEFINVNLVDGYGGTFDHGLSIAAGEVAGKYAMSGLIKKLEWQNGSPYGIENASGQKIRFYTLHCQGPFKAFMADYYHGPDFAGRWRLTVKFRYRKYQFILERMIKVGVKSCLAKLAPVLLQRLR